MTKRVLVVDDDRVAVTALCKLLRMDGFEAVGSVEAAEALGLLGAEPFDAVVTDLEMPGVHGLEVIKAALANRRELPVWVVTAYADSPTCLTALSLGASGVLPKPLRYDALLEALRRCLGP